MIQKGQQHMELVRRLEDISPDDVTLAGGKGANLGALVRAGFSVPAGFVLLTSAYQLFIQVNGIQQVIEQLAGSIIPGDPSSSEQASIAIGALLEAGKMPGEVAEAVLTAYTQLGEPAVAVRSSATTEDLPGASFAGQQETYLNIHAPGELLIAVQRCWSSLWTARALDYRARQGINPGSVSMAVVIQQLVHAGAAGVLFTVNPVTGASDEVLINAAWGLGETLVEGRVTPDTIVTEKASGRVKQMEIGDKAIMTVPSESGMTEQAVDPKLRQAAVLSPDQIKELTLLAREIEKYFSTPQDIEWAIAGGQIFILQSRPVTTRSSSQLALRRQEEYDVPGDDSWDRQNEPPQQPFDLWTRTNLGENFPFPVSPLSSTAWPVLFIQGEIPKRDHSPSGTPPPGMGRRFYGRIYVNEGAVVHMATEMGIPASFIDATWGSSDRGMRQSDDKFHPLRLIRRLPSLIGRAVKQPRQQPKQPNKRVPKLTTDQMFAQIDRWVSDFQKQELSQLDDRALWAQGVPVWGERAKMLFPKVLMVGIIAATAFYFLERRVNTWTGSKKDASKLVMSLSGVYAAEIGPALWQMAQTLRELELDTLVLEKTPEEALTFLQNTPEAMPFIKQFRAFLQQFGHRCPNDAELLNPRWADAPEQVITLLTGYLRADERVNLVETERRQRQEREETTRRIETQLNPFRRAIFRWLLKTTQQNVRARDNYRSYLTKFLYPMRKLLAELGQHWVSRGWLKQPEDIFFLTVPEIDEIITSGDPSILNKDLHTIVADRRAAFDYWHHIVPPDAIGPDGTPLSIQVTNGTFLQGVAASGGQVRGTARLVGSVQEATLLTSNDILVTQATDPGWTAVFPLVSGIVLEIGGQLSHGAIIAREYAIPAVINVPGAMQSIRDGQTIMVDGTSGRVYLDEVAFA
jgi:rifampicin phosphotransferase